MFLGYSFFSSFLRPSIIYPVNSSVIDMPLLIAIILALVFNSGSIFIDSWIVPGFDIVSWISFCGLVSIQVTSYFSIYIYISLSIYGFLYSYIEKYICRFIHRIDWQRDFKLAMSLGCGSPCFFHEHHHSFSQKNHNPKDTTPYFQGAI